MGGRIMSEEKKESYVSIEEAAIGYKVMPSDVLQWIKEGKIRANKQEDNTYIIPLKEYQRYGSSFSEELRLKIGEYMWKSIEQMAPSVQKHVSERFKYNSQFVLERDEKTVKILEEIHKKYEPGIDLLNDKRGAVASFIIYARVISLLYSIIKLLRSAIPSESFILLRPLWEAILLAEYFLISDMRDENKNVISKWFNNNRSPAPSDVRYYVAKTMNLPIETLKELYDKYSKPVHHTYNTIMESYREINMSGFLGEHSKSLGFDYNESTVMRDIITLVEAFENLLESSLQGFYLCFGNSIPLSQEEQKVLNDEMLFYSKSIQERLDIIFGKNEEHHA